MKKAIVLSLMLLLLCGCEKKEEVKCPEQKEKVYISYNQKEMKSEDVIKELDDYTFNKLISKIKYEMLNEKYKENKELLEEANKKGNETIELLKNTYGSAFEKNIIESTGFDSAEDYKNYLINAHIENEYVIEYILNNDELNIKNKEEINNEIHYKYYYEAIKALFDENKLTFNDETLTNKYNDYMNDIKEFSLNAEANAAE